MEIARVPRVTWCEFPRSWLAFAMFVLPLAANAQEDADELAKKLSNPVAALISVPLQLNWDTNIGADELTLTFNTESTYDWQAEQWTVPLNVIYSKVTKIGGQLVSVAGGARYYVEAPDGGPEWGLRSVFTLLYPR